MYISGGIDPLSCKLFLGTLQGVAMHWLATLPSRSIRSFDDLAASFVSQFVANRIKRLEVVDLFDFRQAQCESLKSYLAWFNNATVRVNNLDQNDALALRRLTSMGEIRIRVEKHIEAEEDKEDRVLVEKATSVVGQRIAHEFNGKQRYDPRMEKYTPLKTLRVHILKEAYHLQLLYIPPPMQR
ncbi:hypothetical protein CR513_54564, partial [Mucuna pruriens]